MTTPDFAQETLNDAACAFGLNPAEAKPLSGGHLHETFRLKDAVLQRLHPDLASDAAIADTCAVHLALEREGFASPRILKAKAGGFTYTDRAARRWRATTYIEGDPPARWGDLLHPEAAIRSLGALLAKFHLALERRKPALSAPPIHDPQGHLQRLRAVYQASKAGDPLMEAIERGYAKLPPWPAAKTFIHGDPKLQNLRFQKGIPCALIDLDGCACASALFDLGDAARAFFAPSVETAASLRLYRALCEGYGEFRALTAGERDFLPWAPKAIRLELAARYLRDAFEHRRFAFDAARYESHSAQCLQKARDLLWDEL